jgi:hypothetical protein
MFTDKVRQFICGLHGHDALLHYEQGRIALQCTSCGYQTPGWDLKPSVAEPKPVNSTLTRMPLFGARRVA